MENNYTLKKLNLTRTILSCLLFSSFSLTAQTLNFTIDTATDNGTDITETISMGIDNFVLTISHPGNEELDNLGGGDLIVFIGSGGAILNESYTISLTKNGNPFGFTLNSLGYDTLEAGDISIENQDDAIITPNTNYPLGAGTITSTNTTNATDISSFKITPNDTDSSSELNDFGFHDFNITVGSILNTTEFESGKLTLYPNPSNGEIVIRNNSLSLQNLTITDTNGRTVASIDLAGVTGDNRMDLSSLLVSGIYIAKIATDTNFIIRKLIIN